MKITVIITVFNLEQYVREALESVFSQTRQPDEVIVVNDGSTDRSDSIISEYLERINYINKKDNEGVLPAILSAINISTGEIILFLDGDDVWINSKIEKTEQIFKFFPDVMLVTHNYQWIDKHSHLLSKVDKTHKNLSRIGGSTERNYIFRSEELKKSVLSYRGVWLGSAFSIRRKYFDSNHFMDLLNKLDKNLINLSHQDQPIAAFMIAVNPDKHLYFLDETLFYYRVYGTNSSGNTNNLQAAMATLKRSKATVKYTSHIIAVHMPERKNSLRMQQAHLAYLSYLEKLYNHKPKSAIYNLSKAIYMLSPKEMLKECVRLLFISIFGPEKFFKTK